MRNESDPVHKVAPLTDRVPVQVLHLLQDRFAALGQVSVCICALDGARITQPTWGSPYSASIGTSQLGRLAYDESIRALAQSPDEHVPSVCHEGLNMYATRVRHRNHELALIIVGTRPTYPPSIDEARAAAVKYGIDPDALAASVAHLGPHTGATPEATHQFADTLAETIAMLYAQADRIQHQLTNLSVVHELSNLLAGRHDLQEILDLTVTQVTHAVSIKAAGIRLLNRETGELEIRAVHNLSQEYLQKGRVVLQDNPIDSAAFRGETVYIEDAPSDPRIRYPANAKREGIVSGLCVPMTYHGFTVGVLRVYTAAKRRFSDSEISLLRSLASQAASAVISSRLLSEREAAEVTRRQMESAAQIQRRMIPTQPPVVTGFGFGCVYEPTLAVGGDFFDFVRLADGRIAVVIADVVGKGLPAALLMASIRAGLRTTAQWESTIGGIMRSVNRQLARDTLPHEFATLFLAALSSDGASLEYCNAGHQPPLLVRAGRIEKLDVGGLVTGVDPSIAYDTATISIELSDLLVLITDGVTDAEDFSGEAYGMNRLVESVHRHEELCAQMIAKQLLWDVRRFAGLTPQTDDITVVTVKRQADGAQKRPVAALSPATGP